MTKLVIKPSYYYDKIQLDNKNFKIYEEKNQISF